MPDSRSSHSLMLLLLSLGLGLLLAAGPNPTPTAPARREPLVCTFSIVAHDPATGEWGIAVASKYLAVGSAVPFAKAGVGAVATQSYVNVRFGPDGLKLLAEGKSAQETVDALVEADPGRDRRQVGVVDRSGAAACFTGPGCLAWAGHKTGPHFACQGNLLTGPEVIDAMVAAFEESKGPLGWRLMDALTAGDKAGGDRRGKQSAAIYIVKDKAGPLGMSDRFIDLRVDDHADPVPELARILGLRLRRPAQP
ncbi:MAG TPA: DUF1028 domain-containing protein [Gemmatales bacterium]|nr:DUF1028 domain-containing protein [Gemmatales bacterium]HMP60074.1 DUF1028 domain-containing protein [Gemmatales bacterium]